MWTSVAASVALTSFCCINETLLATRKKGGLTSCASHVYLWIKLQFCTIYHLLIFTFICCHNQLLLVVWLHTFVMMCKPSFVVVFLLRYIWCCVYCMLLNCLLHKSNSSVLKILLWLFAIVLDFIFVQWAWEQSKVSLSGKHLPSRAWKAGLFFSFFHSLIRLWFC